MQTAFEGPGREGAVRVIEEEDRYRLVFDACGSGGVMRRRANASGKTLRKLPVAAPFTWHRENEVPAYCSHCATNELASLDRFGYPALVTEFDPDPEKPCGWTIYKRPEAIPETYFTRLGATKDPSRWRGSGGAG